MKKIITVLSLLTTNSFANVLVQSPSLTDVGVAILICPNKSGYLDITYGAHGKYFAVYAGKNGEVSKILSATKAIESDSYHFGNTTLTVAAIQSADLAYPNVRVSIQVGSKKLNTIVCQVGQSN